jgi:tight adherence protein C
VSIASALAAASALLGLAAVRELLAARDRPAPARLPSLDRRALAAGLRLGLPGRIARAGLEGRVSLSAVLAAKGAAALASLPVALWLAPVAPGRLSLPFAAAIPVAGFLAPDALLERGARRRRAEILSALPDALDRLSVSAALGRATAAGFEELTAPGGGALSDELSVAVAEISCGSPQPEALAALRRRVPGPELAGLCAAIERSRRFGSPLAEQIQRQAAALRRDQRRRIEERAARAAPKIQLVVALVLVPSVLLIIVAAVIANADSLFAGF